jgi:hypothetical protein
MVAHYNGQAQPYNTIILGREFSSPSANNLKFLYYGSNLASYQQGTLVHEYMHILNNANDTDLARKWDLKGKGYEGHPSNMISEFLIADCQPNPDRKSP